MAAPRRVSILGSTGSIGCSTLDIIEHHGDAFVVEALTAHRNVERLAAQAIMLRPRVAVIGDAAAYRQLKEALSGTGVAVAAGPDALVEAAHRPADWTMAAIVGAAGLEPTIAAIRRGAVVALANKECLVSAGRLMMDEVRAAGATLLPVDSEHNAIFQVFDFEQPESVESIILTASGGPFRTMDRAVMAHVTPAQAIAHPNWDMGAKISVDSATLMNKGLELIEAHHLFGLPAERIEILIHPQSVIHGMVAYVDGSVLAHLGAPDMRTPIAHALGWPERISTPAARLDLAKLGQLTFEPPDLERFPALRLAGQALKTGGAAPTILNAANEIAVQGFLAGRIGFLDIARIVEETLATVDEPDVSDLSEIRDIDHRARAAAQELLGPS
jgi:1-deoxy-D-xylulose-5-phosphate reductoisomerase